LVSPCFRRRIGVLLLAHFGQRGVKRIEVHLCVQAVLVVVVPAAPLVQLLFPPLLEATLVLTLAHKLCTE
jgi:hypothetical protein